MIAYTPAFPTRDDSAFYHGISERDYFAINAMQGICSHPDTKLASASVIANRAYEIADAMIEARIQDQAPT